MGGVDHDGRTEFTADGAGRRLGWIRGSEDVADLVHSANAFIDEGDAFFRAGLGPVGLRNIAGRVVPAIFAVSLAELRSESLWKVSPS